MNNSKKIYLWISAMLALVFVVICIFTALDISTYKSGFYDREAIATVIESTDVTDRSKGELDNGGPSLSYKILAQYNVNGQDYTIETTLGSPLKAGDEKVIYYHAQDPAQSIWVDKPDTSYMRMKMLHLISGILLALVILAAIWKIITEKKRKNA